MTSRIDTPAPLTVFEARRLARERLAAVGNPEPADDALYLLGIVLNWNRLQVLANSQVVLSAQQQKIFADLLRFREVHFPLQYMSGRQEFYGRDFKVGPTVLIPRPETEGLIDVGLSLLKDVSDQPIRVLDVGTGSGCLAVTIACHIPHSSVVALDPSPAALWIAHQNVLRHNCGRRVELVCGDLRDLPNRRDFHLILSNPPYLSTDSTDQAGPGVLQFEPHQALIADHAGLEVYRQIFRYSPGVAAAGASLVVELAFDNLEGVRDLARRYGWGLVSLHRDLAGWERVARFQHDMRDFDDGTGQGAD